MHSYSHQQTCVRVRKLISELRHSLLENSTIEEYIFRIKALIDALSEAGDQSGFMWLLFK